MASVTVERRKAEGKCNLCEEPAEKGRSLCLGHLLEGTEKARLRRMQLKRDGICVACAKHNAAEDRTQCQVCIDKAKERRKSNRFERKCTSCNKDNQNPFYKMCDTCRGISVSGSAIRKSVLLEKQQCFRCKGPVDTKCKHCSKCLELRKQDYARKKAKGICPGCKCVTEDSSKSYCEECLRKSSIRCKNRGQVLKQQVMDAYGGKCACCGTSELVFLNIDHVNNDGAIDRKIGLKGGDIYRMLRDTNYPSGYQVLCFNCNFAKYHLGKCPHGSKKESKADYTGYRSPDHFGMFSDPVVLSGLAN